MKCLNCGEIIDEVLVNTFIYDSSDTEIKTPIEHIYNETGRKLVGGIIRTTYNWTGYELTDEERKETILCPICKKYPFNKNDEIETNEVLEVICFK